VEDVFYIKIKAYGTGFYDAVYGFQKPLFVCVCVCCVRACVCARECSASVISSSLVI
jgi:hypothetical protein